MSAPKKPPAKRRAIPPFEPAKGACAEFIRTMAKGKCAWTFAVPWPHETFTVLDGVEPFCVGVVFALADVAAPRSGQKGGA